MQSKTCSQKSVARGKRVSLGANIAVCLYHIFNTVTLPRNLNTNPDVLKVIYKLIHTLHLLICQLMSPCTQRELEIDNAVKLFLSCCHKFCKVYWKDSVKPFWSRTGNYPTLLCLPRQQRHHGPVRMYWEGTSERFIQTLKRELTAMRRTSQYCGKKMTKLFKRNVLEWKHESLFANDHLNRVVTRKDRMYYQYGDWSETQSLCVNGQVILAFLCRGEESDCLRLAYGRHLRSGMVSTAKLCRNVMQMRSRRWVSNIVSSIL